MVAPEQKLRDGLMKKGGDGGFVSKAKTERYVSLSQPFIV
jgi:hypothetical protein